MQADLILQQPDAAEDPELLLLFQGVGSSADDLRPLGQALAARRSRAWVIGVRSPDPTDVDQVWQWFSVQGVTEANRPERVAAGMPAFLEKVGAWQRHTGVGTERTTLIGFSQGAIMAPESTQQPNPLNIAASRVIAIAGRFAHPPRHAPAGAFSTFDRFAGLGHGIDTRVVEAIFRQMSPLREESAA